jgi:hypothetical protein
MESIPTLAGNFCFTMVMTVRHPGMARVPLGHHGGVGLLTP